MGKTLGGLAAAGLVGLALAGCSSGESTKEAEQRAGKAQREGLVCIAHEIEPKDQEYARQCGVVRTEASRAAENAGVPASHRHKFEQEFEAGAAILIEHELKEGKEGR